MQIGPQERTLGSAKEAGEQALKSQDNDPENSEISQDPNEKESIQRATQAGIDAARRGTARELVESSFKKRKYSDAQVKAFRESYNRLAGTDKEQGLKGAKGAGYRAASKCLDRPTESELIGRGYDKDEINECLKGYDARVLIERKKILKGLQTKVSSTNEEVLNEIVNKEIGIQRANKVGRIAGLSGVNLDAAEIMIINRRYNEEQTEAFRKGYVSSGATQERLALKKAHKAGYNQAGRNSACRPSIEKLIDRGYHEELAKEYLRGFDDKVAKLLTEDSTQSSEAKKALKKIKKAATDAVDRGVSRAEIEMLIARRKLNTEQAKAFREEYARVAKTEEVQALRKAVYLARRTANRGLSRAEAENLIAKRKLNTEQAKAFREEYARVAKTEEEQAAKKAAKARPVKRRANRGKNVNVNSLIREETTSTPKNDDLDKQEPSILNDEPVQERLSLETVRKMMLEDPLQDNLDIPEEHYISLFQNDSVFQTLFNVLEETPTFPEGERNEGSNDSLEKNLEIGPEILNLYRCSAQKNNNNEQAQLVDVESFRQKLEKKLPTHRMWKL